jgi:predicted phage terminase large subunit-like protein
MEYDGVSRASCLGVYDHRSKFGDLLWPDRFGVDEVERLKLELGSYSAAGQLQQSPSPIGGGLIRESWFKLFNRHKNVPEMIHVVQSYDTAFTEKTSGDPTACCVFGVFYNRETHRKEVLLLDCWTEHLAYPDLRRKVSQSWDKTYAGGAAADVVLIENKGSGMSLIQDLRRTVISIRDYNPGKADKTARVHRVAPLLEAGLLSVMEGKSGEASKYASQLLDQATRFPTGAHDDLVDALTQAFIYLQDGGFLKLDEDYEPPADPYVKQRTQNPYAM